MNRINYYFARIFDKLAIKYKRDDYKNLWNRLSITKHQAMLNVIGDSSDEGVLHSGLEFREILSETIGIKKQDKILEIGCGIGRIGTILSPLCETWIGCDVSLNMLRIAKNKLKIVGNTSFLEISGYDLSCIRSSSLDVVYCTTVFMHLEEWDRYNYVKEGFRVLKDQGRILIDNFTIFSEEGWKTFLEHCSIPIWKRTPYISKSSTPQELEIYLQRAGFNDISVRIKKEFVFAYGKK